jgi:hypothetical protein
VANSWSIYTTESLTMRDVRAEAEASLTELLAGTASDEWKPLRLFSIEGMTMTPIESEVIVTGEGARDETEAILRASTGDQVFVRATPVEVSLSLATKTDFGTALAMAAAVGVSRRVRGKADYGHSILPDVHASRDWDGHDPEVLMARLRLAGPASDLSSAIRSVLAHTGLGHDD